MVVHQRSRPVKIMPKDKTKVKAIIIKKLKKVKRTVKRGLPFIRHQAETSWVNALGHKIPVGVRDMFFSDHSAQLGKFLLDYISAKDAVVKTVVPGDLYPTRSHEKTADHVRSAIGALMDWFVQLIDLQLSLNGQFDLSDWGITHSGFVKGTMNLMDKLLPSTEASTSNDMFVLAIRIEDIFSNAPPPDIADLIEVLKNFKPALKPLLLIHVARENSTRKSVLFTKMYDRLVAIKDKTPATYMKILNQIPLENWVHRAMTNVHLHHLLRFSFGSPASTLEDQIVSFLCSHVRYDPTREGLLEFRRNGEAHLLKDYSFDSFGGLEEAWGAAIAAAAVVVPSLATVIAAGNQQLPAAKTQPLPTRKNLEFGAFLTKHKAIPVFASIDIAIRGYKMSREAAKAAAEAAATDRMRHAHMALPVAQTRARIEGSKAGQAVLLQLYNQAQGSPATLTAVKPISMFDEEEICAMMELVEPNLLHKFQRAMFDEGQLNT